MSRTDVHTPYRVKLRDRGWAQHFVDEHRHEHGTCSLAEFLADRDLTYWQGCYRNFVSTGTNVHCGCRMCTNQVGRRHARRAERVEVRAKLRAAVKTPAMDRDLIDVPPSAASRKW
jgi:hypothetical protein